MKIVVAIDSFKGSMSSLQAGQSAAEGIKRVFKGAQVEVCPLADGGEGTVEALTLGCKGELCKTKVTGPLGRSVWCDYGIVKETGTSIIEMSGAAGITLISEAERNPLNATTYGVGEVIKEAIQKGCRRFIIGIGGSATNDGGIGMLQALGFGMLNQEHKQVAWGAKGLQELAYITNEKVLPELKECSFKVACDVTNPLCGEKGCSHIFGPQKGATPEMIRQMDTWLEKYAKLAKEKYLQADATQAGVGAAGGLGFAFFTFLNATLESGTKIVLEETKLEEKIRTADLVLTGEGRLDGQTVMGKAPIGVAKLAKKYNLPVLGFAGCVTKEATACHTEGIDAFFPVLRSVVTLEEAMSVNQAAANMADTVEQVFRVIKTFRG